MICTRRSSNWWFGPAEEWLAFSRDGKNIMLMKTVGLGLRWPDTLITVTTDSMDNDYPSLTRAFLVPFQESTMMLVWQSRTPGSLDIFYSLARDSVWTPPQSIATLPGNDRYPHLTYRDGGFGAVWENDGRIMFSQYVSNQWSPPEFVTAQNDTTNTFPNLHFVGSPATIPLVVWQRSKAPAAGNAIMYSIRRDTGWTRPDTLWAADDNQKPRFFKVRRYVGNFVVTWNQTTGGMTRLVMRDGDYVGSDVRWNPLYIPPQPTGVNTDAAFNGTIIVSQQNNPSLYWSVGVWSSSSAAGRGQIMALHSFNPQPINLTETLSGFNRHPDVGTGAFREGAYHIWTVWENFQDRTWKLYGCYTSFGLLSVGDGEQKPERFALHQNYPNPFNPVTTIRFEVRGSGFVSLKVYDVLGREVATLVNEVQDAGFKSVVFDGSNLPSGVYMYRLTSNGFSQARRMILLK